LSEATFERLFDPRQALDDPVTRGVLLGVATMLLLAPPVMLLLFRLRRVDTALRTELWKRYASWLVLSPLMGVPVLLGAAWTMAATGLLSLMCYREYARATKLFTEKVINAIVVLGIFAITFAVIDHWYGLFVALVPLTVIAIATAGILPDRPRGYIHRVALGTLGFLLFGSCLGHLGYMANDAGYRPILATLLLCVEMNDVFAYICGRTLGRRPLAPNTSPGKTVAGALGAFTLTTALFAFMGHYLFRNTTLDHPAHLIAMGVIISVGGQLGDLMLSSIKRDLGVKDLGVVIPGHGGLLDRFDSLILVAPAFYHYVGYQLGFGLDQQTRLLTGG
jgi:phosphatidate cytidylyltransferase